MYSNTYFQPKYATLNLTKKRAKQFQSKFRRHDNGKHRKKYLGITMEDYIQKTHGLDEAALHKYFNIAGDKSLTK